MYESTRTLLGVAAAFTIILALGVGAACVTNEDGSRSIDRSVAARLGPYALEYRRAETKEEKVDTVRAAVNELTGYEGGMAELVARYIDTNLDDVQPSAFLVMAIGEVRPELDTERVMIYARILTAVIEGRLDPSEGE